MDLFAITRSLWQHKRVAIPVILLTIIGVFYAVAIKAPSYQAEADVLLVNPPTPPTAADIAQDPRLAKVDNPYANLGSITYVADVVITIVTSVDSQQSLEEAGASPGYKVTLDTAGDSSGQSSPPPALDITEVASSPQAAIESVNLVAAAISGDLRHLQKRQHVESASMITAVEYVTPTSAVKSSAGKLEMGLGIAVVGFLVLLTAVSAAQGFQERRNAAPRHGRQPESGGSGRNGPAVAPDGARHGELQRASARADDSWPGDPVYRGGPQHVGGNGQSDQGV